MPAVTADTLTLPRLPEPAAGAAERPVASVSAAPSGFEGEGFPVRRAFAGVFVTTTSMRYPPRRKAKPSAVPMRPAPIIEILGRLAGFNLEADEREVSDLD